MEATITVETENGFLSVNLPEWDGDKVKLLFLDTVEKVEDYIFDTELPFEQFEDFEDIDGSENHYLFLDGNWITGKDDLAEVIADEQERKMKEQERQREAFNDYIVKPVKKKRKCLRCGKEFISQNAGHRRCATCGQAIEKWSDRAESLGVL
jgi:hypothetical protein